MECCDVLQFSDRGWGLKYCLLYMGLIFIRSDQYRSLSAIVLFRTGGSGNVVLAGGGPAVTIWISLSSRTDVRLTYGLRFSVEPSLLSIQPSFDL